MRFSISTSPDWIANINSSSRLALSTPGTAEDGLLFLLSDLIPRLATELPARAGDRGEGDFFRVFFALRLVPFFAFSFGEFAPDFVGDLLRAVDYFEIMST